MLAVATGYLFLWDNLKRVGIIFWWRWRPPLVLILLKNIL